jgi:hypothetical protein
MHRGRLIGGAILALALLPGCVSRKLFLRSEPPGATVFLDGQWAGTTPYEEELPAWGTRRLELQLDGYERVDTDLELSTPWWDWFPLDMISAAMPWTIHADREFGFTLVPAPPLDTSWDAVEKAAARVRASQPETQP